MGRRRPRLPALWFRARGEQVVGAAKGIHKLVPTRRQPVEVGFEDGVDRAAGRVGPTGTRPPSPPSGTKSAFSAKRSGRVSATLPVSLRSGRRRQACARPGRRRPGNAGRRADTATATTVGSWSRSRSIRISDQLSHHFIWVRLPWRDVKPLWAGRRRGIGTREPACVPGPGGTTSSRPSNRWPVAPAA